MNKAAQDILNHYCPLINEAKNGEKSRLVDEVVNKLGVSKATFYRMRSELGLTPKRKSRSDKGSSSVDDATVRKLAAMRQAGTRANGKVIMETTTATGILATNGHTVLSASSMNRLLRQKGLSAKTMVQPTAHQQLASQYPNHIHEVDPSYCVLYYPPGSKEQKVQHYTSEDEFYQNKPEKWEKIKHLRVWRYTLTDHASGTIMVRYYESAGETQMIMFEFLCWCWSKMEWRLFYGVPYGLLWDKGSANGAHAIKNWLDAMGVNHITHKTKRARVKGSVEKANDLVEKKFESRLRFEPVNSVEELNESAIAWQEAFNANRIPHEDNRHSRHGKARYHVWQQIMSAQWREHLRELPPIDVCRYFFTAKEEPRTVDGELKISFVHPLIKERRFYDLSHCAEIGVGMKVKVRPMLTANTGSIVVGVTNPAGETAWHEAEPVEYNELGFRLDAPVIGEEYKEQADTDTDKARKELDRVAYPDMTDEEIQKAKQKQVTPFKGELIAHSYIKSVEHATPIKLDGQTITPESDIHLPTPEQPDAAYLDLRTTKSALFKRLQRALSPPELDLIADRVEEGLTENDLQELADQLRNGLATAVITPLKAVN